MAVLDLVMRVTMMVFMTSVFYFPFICILGDSYRQARRELLPSVDIGSLEDVCMGGHRSHLCRLALHLRALRFLS
jgi:hypothetical protein